jgi:hypothetical protein
MFAARKKVEPENSVVLGQELHEFEHTINWFTILIYNIRNHMALKRPPIQSLGGSANNPELITSLLGLPTLFRTGIVPVSL